MLIRYIFISLLFFCFLACEQKGGTTSDTATAVPIEKEEMQNNSPSTKLSVYDKFEDIEYIFNQQNDTTYVINFWATWCKPCVAELPYFDDLFKEFEDDKLKIILVSLDFPKQLDTKLKPFLKKHNVLPEVKMLKDSNVNRWGDKVSDEWDGAIPITLIYNKDKRLFVSGELEDYAALKEKVHPLVIN